jgi:hemolysin III
MTKAHFDNPTNKEELANAITHGIGAIAAVAGLIILILLTDIRQEPGYFIYGISLVVLYLTSTLYHSITHLKAKNIFRKLDHMAIFFLIAGTYTPFCLNALDGWMRWALLVTIWACAALGIIMKSFCTGKLEWLSVILYIIMGWMGILAIKPMFDSLTALGFLLLLTGGIAYTSGTYFYVNRQIRFHHSIWHLWVLAGSTFHFFSILTLAV